MDAGPQKPPATVSTPHLGPLQLDRMDLESHKMIATLLLSNTVNKSHYGSPAFIAVVQWQIRHAEGQPPAARHQENTATTTAG